MSKSRKSSPKRAAKSATSQPVAAGLCPSCGRFIHHGFEQHVAACTPVAAAKGACPKCGRPLKQGARWHIASCNGVRRTPEEIRTKRDAQRARHHRKRLGAYSRIFSRRTLNAQDLNSIEGRFLRRIEEELCQHVGGHPSVAETLLISRAARAALRLELFDRKFAHGKDMSPQDGKVYGALHNSLRLILRDLGLKGKAAEPRLGELMTAAAARRAGA